MSWSWGSGGWGWDTNWGGAKQRSRKRDFQPIEQAEDTRITPDMSPSEVELRIRRRIERMQAERSSFMGNLIGYITVNVILWAIYAQGIGAFFFFWGLPWPVFVTLFWGLNLARRGYSLYQNAPERVAQRENRLQREVDRMKAVMGYSASDDPYQEKPKNDQKPKNDWNTAPIRLTTDGELISDTPDILNTQDADIGDESIDDYRAAQSDSYHSIL